MPASRGSSRPRNRTLLSYLSCLADRFVTVSATCEALKILIKAKQCSILRLKMEIKLAS